MNIKGVLSPVLTPFNTDLEPDHGRFLRHCQGLVAQGVGLAVFGINPEAASLSVLERTKLLHTLIEAGIPAQRMMPGTGNCALPDTIELTRRAVQAGCVGVLMPLPFYFKGVSDEGLYNAHATVIDKVADATLRIYVLHIPQVSQVPISLRLIERLLKDFAGTIAGVKDSSGDWQNTAAMLKEFQPQGFDVVSGSETFMLATLRGGGGVGCITATGNVNPAPIVQLHRQLQQADADGQQAGLDAVRGVFARFPMIPAMKAASAGKTGRADWCTLRRPLLALNSAQRTALMAALDEVGFKMPNAQCPMPNAQALA